MLIDMGQYKIDITVNQIIDSSGKIKILTNSIGDIYGSMNINNDLMDKIKFVLGDDIIEKAKYEHFENYLETILNIENIKKDFQGNEEANYEIYAKFEKKVTSGLEKFKKWIFGKKENKDKNYGIVYDKYKIYILGKILKEILDKRISEIINYIHKIKNILEKNKSFKINNIILSGGFSNNKFLVKELKKEFHNTHISVLFNQEFSVMKGAILYILNKNRIQSKICDLTYEIETIQKYEPNDKCNKIMIINNEKFCQKIDFLIKKYDKIIYNNIIKKSFRPIINNKIFINFYKNKKGINSYFGNLEIDLEEFGKKVVKPIINIDLSTYFHLYVSDEISKKPIKYFFHIKDSL